MGCLPVCVCSSVRMCVPLSVPLSILLSVCPSHSCLLYHTCKISDKLTDSRKMQCSLRLLSACLSVCLSICFVTTFVMHLAQAYQLLHCFGPTPHTHTKKDRSWAVKYLWFYSIVGCGWDTWFIARTSKYFEQKFNFTLFQVFPSTSDFANFGTLTRTLLLLLSKIVWPTIKNW